LVEAAAGQSYGIYVAKLAGIPKPILKRSQDILKNLENNNQQSKAEVLPPKKGKSGTQLCFFDEPLVPQIPQYLENIENEIKALDLNNMTPIEALGMLNDLKGQLTLQ